jgi:hypothetical protein
MQAGELYYIRQGGKVVFSSRANDSFPVGPKGKTEKTSWYYFLKANRY